MCHDPVSRWHIRLERTTEHEVWLLGWSARQAVEFHDHGGSAGAFCVIEGELVEEYGRNGVLRRTSWPAGAAHVFPPAHIHHVWNRGPATAKSIHVYSPPLSVMTFYGRGPRGALRPTRTEAVPS